MEVKIHGVSKSYKNIDVLNNINLTISKGVFGILGPNGSGKTTLMRILMALVKADKGDIIINNISINEKNKIRECVSYLPQEFSFYPSMSIIEAMDYMAILSGIKASEDRINKINELLDKVNLLKHKKKRFKTLSGGMKRRLGIAIALLKDPKVLIVDEPTAGLDPDERVRFRKLISDFARDRIVILSTHIVEDIENMCQDIAIISDGEIIYSGSKKDLVSEAIGKVKLVEVEYDEINNIQEKYYVISVCESNSRCIMKIITDDNIGKETEVKLEDAYLTKIHKLHSNGDLLC